MLWDTTLPAVVGYLAAMLANQNNVAAEASPVTTAPRAGGRTGSVHDARLHGAPARERSGIEDRDGVAAALGPHHVRRERREHRVDVGGPESQVLPGLARRGARARRPPEEGQRADGRVAGRWLGEAGRARLVGSAQPRRRRDPRAPDPTAGRARDLDRRARPDPPVVLGPGARPPRADEHVLAGRPCGGRRRAGDDALLLAEGRRAPRDRVVTADPGAGRPRRAHGHRPAPRGARPVPRREAPRGPGRGRHRQHRGERRRPARQGRRRPRGVPGLRDGLPDPRRRRLGRLLRLDPPARAGRRASRRRGARRPPLYAGHDYEHVRRDAVPGVPGR